jgi:hypothetical protein
MATTSLSTTGMDKLFLDYILPGLEKQYYQNTTVYGRFKTQTETCLGKYGTIKVMTGGAQSIGPRSTTTWPTALSGGYNEFRFYMKRGMYASLLFDGLAVACGKGSGAVKELVKNEIEGITDSMSRRLNRMFWGDGSGRLAQVETGATSATLTLDSPIFGKDSNYYTNPAQYLDEGMALDVYPNTPGSIEVTAIVASGLTDDGDGTGSLTLASSQTFSTDAWLYSPNSYATTEAAGTGVPMGLAGIISASNPYVGSTPAGAFQYVSRATAANAWACAQVFNMGGGTSTTQTVVTTEKMMEVVQKVERYGTINVIITNPVIWRKLGHILVADRTLPNEKAMWGGFTGITFYGGKTKAIPIIFDEDCPDSKMFFIDDSKIVISSPEKGGMQWVPGTDGHVLRMLESADEYAAHLKWYYNMTTNQPKALGLLQYVKHSDS